MQHNGSNRSFINRAIVTLLILPVKIYKYFISPIIPKGCRYLPTCSQYTIEALDIHGPVHGLALSIKRILKCHPFAGFGYDPVPTNNNKDRF